MRKIFNTIASVKPKKVLFTTLFVTGAAVSLAGGQIALASVFAVAALGNLATFPPGPKMIACHQDPRNLSRNPMMPDNVETERKVVKHSINGNGIVTEQWSPSPGEFVAKVYAEDVFQTIEQATNEKGSKMLKDFGF